jgi:hypothetical protein
MLTLFAVPKAFVGHVGVIQDNAIRSWARLRLEGLGHDIEIILLGDEPGVAEAAGRHDVAHVPTARRGNDGTPIVSDILAEADRRARHPLLCYVNADIILMDDFIVAVRRAQEQCQKLPQWQKFLLISSRFNLDIDAPINLAAGWQAGLRSRALKEGKMYPAAGSDFFVYPRGLFTDVPPFALGRGYWDNWLMYAATRRGAALIDATSDVLAVHQNHDYSHISGLTPGSRSDRELLSRAQGVENLRLAGGHGKLYTVYDSDFVLKNGQLLSTRRPALIGRRIKAVVRRGAMMISPRFLRAYHLARARLAS